MGYLGFLYSVFFFGFFQIGNRSIEYFSAMKMITNIVAALQLNPLLLIKLKP